MSIELLRESTLALKTRLDKLPERLKKHCEYSLEQHVTDMMELLDALEVETRAHEITTAMAVDSVFPKTNFRTDCINEVIKSGREQARKELEASRLT
jgi:hypothetical protein